MESPRDSWKEEKRSSYLYSVIASVEEDEKIKKLFRDLGRAADDQAQVWADVIKKTTPHPSFDFQPNLRVLLVARLIRWLGPRRLKAVLAAMKIRGLSIYSRQMPLKEGHPMPQSLSEVGLRHRGSSWAGNLRATVFGVNDGLVSNASLILGMAGAGSDAHVLLLAGVAGCLAGAFSMGAGEYLSVRSQREMFEHQISLEREELHQYPDQEAQELKLIYEARGLDSEEAEKLASQMIQDPKKGLDALAREELGINPEDLVSPWGAAISSFLSFLLGSVIPLVPFLVGAGFKPAPTGALFYSIILTGLSLFGVGSLTSLFTGRNALWSGVRMILIGGGAGTATYFLGKIL